MDNSALRQISQVLEKSNSIGIAVSQNPTLDEMGAALSLYLSLREIGKNVAIASPATPLVEVSSLIGIDKVKTAFEGTGGDLVVSFPYKEGEIDKVSYTLDNGFLNIVVKAGEMGLSFKETDIVFKRGGGKIDLLFVVGVSRVQDLGSLFDINTLKETTVVNIDNKTDNQGFGNVVMVSQNASSVSELVGNLIFSLNLKTNIDIAQNLMAGLSFATGNFQDSKTTPLAFEVAAALIRNGASRQTREMPKRDEALERLSSFVNKQTQQVSQQTPIEDNQKIQDNQMDENPPSDWLAPKIYKGSTTF